jgi:hypothetical protein
LCAVSVRNIVPSVLRPAREGGVSVELPHTHCTGPPSAASHTYTHTLAKYAMCGPLNGPVGGVVIISYLKSSKHVYRYKVSVH